MHISDQRTRRRRRRSGPVAGTLAAALAAAVIASGWAAPAAGDPDDPASFRIDEYYGLGISEYDLDGDTEMLGWQLNRSWYLGREDRRDTVSLVWQGERRRVSISVDEIRFTRRF